MPYRPRLLLVPAVAAAGLLTLGLRGPAALAENAAPASGEWAAAPGWVDTEGGVQRLGARVDGLIERVAIKEGAHVSAGDLLLQMDATQAGFDARSADLEQQRRATEAEALDAKLAHARSEQARLQPLVAQQAEPADELRALQQSIRELRAAQAQSKLAAQAAALAQQQAKDKLGRLSLHAPAAGQVLRVIAHAGEAVSAGAPLLDFVADGPLLVRAEVDERLFGRIKPGQTAEIAPEYDESKKFAAHVLRLAAAVGPVQALPQVRAAAKDDRVVECVLQLDDAAARDALLIGQRVLVRIRGGS